MTMPLYHRWDHRTETNGRVTVLPDGCRDVLVIARPDGTQDLRLTNWDLRPRRVTLQAGLSMTGYRLRPGMTINQAVLRDCFASGGHLQDLLHHESTEIGDVIAALAAPGGTVRDVARAAGVTPRTLQRRFRAQGYPPPSFWQSLGRARRAAAMLDRDQTLADIACDSGFSDQSHMTRAFGYWFGLTPARLSQDETLIAEFRQPALGTWTGEQISIR